MPKKLLITLLFFNIFPYINGQNISGKIVDRITLKPIAEVAIITNLSNGTTSNDFGVYNLNISGVKTITFSSLNYKTITVNLKSLKTRNFLVYLDEKINELNEIQLNLKKIPIDSIVVRTLKSMKKNYAFGAIQTTFYSRENSFINFKKLELNLDKSALLSRKNKKIAEKQLADYAKSLKNSDPNFANEFYGKIKTKKVFSKKLKKYYNSDIIDTVQGYKSLQNRNQITIKDAQNDLQNIVLKNLNRERTYKVSSGLFKIEDSLSINEVLNEADSLQIKNTYNDFLASSGYNTAQLKGKFFMFKNQQNFLNQKYYDHELATNTYLGKEMLYVLKFFPRKSKSKYSGRIYINPKDFTIAKIEYEYAKGKRGQNLNLKWILGIKVSEDLNKATLFYEKNKDNKSYTSYYKETRGTYAYVHRPIKFKENSETKNKVKFDVKMELDTKETKEVLITNTLAIESEKIVTINKKNTKKRTSYIPLNEYNKTHWKNRKLIVEYLKKYE
jgi:hypothetical protein